MTGTKKVRVAKAGEILGLSPVTVRKWAREGKLEYSYSASGQRLFDVDYLKDLIEKKNPKENREKEKIFYVRSSNGKDVLIETQVEKLTSKYGSPSRIFKDKSSGLNDKRVGLRSCLDYVKLSDNDIVLYITNEDRLTRFGFIHLEELFNTYGAEVIALDDKETKDPMEILMDDFMSLIASFSGKFYRIRGWSQQKQLLERASKRVEDSVPK